MAQLSIHALPFSATSMTSAVPITLPLARHRADAHSVKLVETQILGILFESKSNTISESPVPLPLNAGICENVFVVTPGRV